MDRSKIIRKKLAKESVLELRKIIIEELKKEKRDIEKIRRWFFIMKKYSQKYHIKLSKSFKRRFCKRCYYPLIPGVTARVRINDKKITITCLKCGKIYRYPIKRK